MSTREEKERRIAFLEEEMNRAFQELAEYDEIDEVQETEQNKEVEDEHKMEVVSVDVDPEVLEYDEILAEEADRFLGKNPLDPQKEGVKIIKQISDRVKIWTSKGLTEKDEKEKLLKETKRTIDELNLEAPKLNDEISLDLHPRQVSRDEHFREYQNITGSALIASTSVLSSILNDNEEPLDREILLSTLSNAVKLQAQLFFSLTQARRSFVVDRYDEKVQKVLKKTTPTEFLFGDNLKAVIDSTKTMEKVSSDMKPKPKAAFRNNTPALNWKSPNVRREVARGGFRNATQNYSTTRQSQQYRSKPYPMKKQYQQSQPQRNRR